MAVFTQEIETEHRIPAFSIMSTPIENTLIFTRRSGEMVNFAVDHEDVTLMMFNTEENPEEEIHLSFAEARLLKAFFCQPEITEMLSQQ